MNPKRLVDVAGQQAMLIDEKRPGYRADLVRCLTEVIAVQAEGGSDRGRRDKVSRIVEALGSKIAAEKGTTDASS